MKSQKIIKELQKELAKEAKNLRKSLSWFRFAKKTKKGYRFLAHKEAQWKILQEIVKKVVNKYPDYSTGQIVDMLSELVNAQVV